ncbi:MAG: hypothetical protein QW568_04445 [Candidatus Anstonellaceae archaeon]
MVLTGGDDVVGKKEASASEGYNIKIVVLIAAVALFLGGAFVYFGQKSEPPKAFDGKAALASPQAKLLLSALEAGERLSDYSMKYAMIENGVSTDYLIEKAGNASFVKVSGLFGSVEGYFGGPNQSDVVCLEYKKVLKCAAVSNESDIVEIANGMRIVLPNGNAYAVQKAQREKLIESGAINFTEEVADEKIGPFDTKRVTYLLDYSGLSVKTLLSLGISPDDPGIKSTTSQKVSFWMDTKTGMVVRSLANYKENGIAKTYETVYQVLETTTPKARARPANLTTAKEFVSFYTSSQQDYYERASCAARSGQDRDVCFASLAYNKNEPELCGRISDAMNEEKCYVVLAQRNADPKFCDGLAKLADDCYIAVASENGDFELCKKLANTSLGSACTQAATKGQEKAEQKRILEETRTKKKNCVVDADCVVSGASRQFCVAKNLTAPNESVDPGLALCYADLPCSCNEGYCGFVRDEGFYQCVDDWETKQLEDYIAGLANQNSTNASE